MRFSNISPKVLGPFPIHAREQHFLSPSFPLNLSHPIDYSQSWPSSYADGGQVWWSNATTDTDGHLRVSFPNIRWTTLRATEGWAALQYHTVLRTTMTVYPPADPTSVVLPNLIVDLKQGSFFTILPQSKGDIVPQWYSGNIYAMERAPPKTVRFPVLPARNKPTTYDVFIRLFGDPAAYDSENPTLDITMTVELEPSEPGIVHEAPHDIMSDFVDGFAFGEAVGVGLRSVSGWWTVTSSSLSQDIQGLDLVLLRETRIAPGQTRILPLRLTQTAPFEGTDLNVDLTLVSGTSTMSVSIKIPVTHQAIWNSSNFAPIWTSYFFKDTMPTAFNVLPPVESTPRGETPRPPILALHGAGVNILSQPFWAEAIPRQNLSWVVMPTGRTSWGLDWHGPSMHDALDSIDALGRILEQSPRWNAWRLAPETKILVLGHSNGGQGAWYMAARFPDRVVGAVPAAGYIKAQAYVPLTQSRSAHFVDPSLRAILETSHTPDDNDLFLSNLVDTPILAIHGGDDDNVPTWHSREAVNVLKTWNPGANVSYREDLGQPHWYSTVFRNDQVAIFLRSLLQPEYLPEGRSDSYTLTVAIPSESGSLHGWRILSLVMPGRLARLFVEEKNHAVSVKTSNVASFSFDIKRIRTALLIIDGVDFSFASDNLRQRIILLQKTVSGWELHGFDMIAPIAFQPSGRLAMVLQSTGPLTLVVPNIRASSRALSVAYRIAHDLDVYHKLDAEIVTDETALGRLEKGELGPGNIVVVAATDSEELGPFARTILGQGRTVFSAGEDGTTLKWRGRSLDEPSQGSLFLHPHPTNPSANILFMMGSDISGLERIAGLFPIRTGVSLPDWLIAGGAADMTGAAGVQAAGIWGADWSWKEAVSWHH
ncbi:hypothetical protein EW146_g4658 [Bondarzewia mesenterica]|uniref:Peptidase S9 prolyl oligopeptidase catalytic domain-containing protein n=1 Tax=Bondarzewia mesenterica TaxID=1095465 RepID=A0A4S4LTV7_9AGAM|nr:hypothetical protein EW146_g4658 [Bondarzewia mesenterica]